MHIRFPSYILTISILLSSSVLTGQDLVDINLDVEHSVNGVSELDRSKYFMIHASAADREWPGEAVKRQFLEDYDVYLGRNNGSMPWYLSQCRQDPLKPGWPSVTDLQQTGAGVVNSYKNNTTVHQYESRRSHYMVGGQEVMYPNQTRLIGPAGQQWYMAKDGYEPLAEFYANYLKYFYGDGGSTGMPLPAYVEVMNEPFVKTDQLGTTNENISVMHNVVARRIRELNPQVKVGGYSAAHPAYEAADFKHWERNWKLFMDIAGEEMDFFALHLYDNIKNEPGDQYRAGSNIEAILDMIEHYGYLKFGKVKPFNISEYGCLAASDGQAYTRERDWNNIRSFSTIMMQLLERQDVIDMALPFLLLKAEWWSHDTGNKYPHRLFRQKKELAGETGEEWVYTEVVKFYQLWSNVKGTRIDTKSSNPDIQVDTYVDGNKAYVIVNNMHQEARTVDLYLHGNSGIPVNSVLVRHLHAENAGIPSLDEFEVDGPVHQIHMGREATVILEYTFGGDIQITESSLEKKYYADRYFQKITANQQIDFLLDSVSLGSFGEAVLRLGTGRNFGKSLQPVVTINGVPVPVPENLRGGDQTNRDRFFGVLEIPVPFAALQEENLVAVTFPDDGGHVSSLTMQVFNFSRAIERTGSKILGVHISEEGRIMKPGKKFQLEAVVSPVNFENKNITWLSTDTSVVKVSETGQIEARAEGSAEIIVITEVDQLTDTCHVNVSWLAPDILAESIKISPGSLNLTMSFSGQLTVEVLPLDVDNPSVYWSSSDSSIASVDSNGYVTALGLGSTYIRASSVDGSSIADSVVLFVSPLPNTVDCSLFPGTIETDSILGFDVKYTLGEVKDIALIMFKNGVTLPWVAENQVTVEPGAGTVRVNIQVKEKESGLGVIPQVDRYIIYAYVRDVGGDATTNSARCFSSITLLERNTVNLNDLYHKYPVIYPNPARDVIKISNFNDQIQQLVVYNMQGLICLEFAGGENQTYEISTLPEGMYLIKLVGKDESEVKVLMKR